MEILENGSRSVNFFNSTDHHIKTEKLGSKVKNTRWPLQQNKGDEVSSGSPKYKDMERNHQQPRDLYDINSCAGRSRGKHQVTDDAKQGEPQNGQ